MRRSALARMARLSPPERGIVCRALLGLPAAAILLPLFGPSRLLRALPAVSSRTSPSPALSPALAPSRIVALVAATGSWMPWQPTCLHRSLVSAWLLAREGCGHAVVLGLRRPGERTFDAHAWIEIDGVPAESLPEGHWTSLLRWSMSPAPR